MIASDDKPANIRFVTIPTNAIPSVPNRTADFPGFLEVVSTKLEAPFKLLMGRLEPAYEVRIRQPCGMSVCRTHGYADTRRIRVRYATWRIVDQIVGQRLGYISNTVETRLDTA